MFAGGVVAMDKLAAGDARNGLAMPCFVSERTKRPETGAGGDLQGMIPRRRGVVEFRNLRI
jgi:hypothetical protein